MMKLQTASRKRSKMKMSCTGPSGSGKTMSSLLVAYGLCNDWSKIAVIDTENHSAELYAHLGNYNVLPLSAPYTPEKYSEAIDVCTDAGMEVIIIDSLTHEWEYLLDYHSSLQGNSFTNWSKVTPRHNEFVQKILQSPAHVIATMRTKQDYVLSEKNGKMVPEKVGLKTVQRDGMDYEFTLVFDLDIKNNATASKDRTRLFAGKPEQKLSIQTGKIIQDWCNAGADVTAEDLQQLIKKCTSVQQLRDLYNQYPEYKTSMLPAFEEQKKYILSKQDSVTQLLNLKIHQNGTSH
jgi:hypothetical protein